MSLVLRFVALSALSFGVVAAAFKPAAAQDTLAIQPDTALVAAQQPDTAPAGIEAGAAATRAIVFRVPVTGIVELGLAPFIERSIREAARAGAQAVILEIETPGGRVDAAWRIASTIGDAPVPVYAYVNRHALSAGALIALATERIFMRTGSTMGAATPVMGEGEKAPEKIVSAMRSEMRALAEARGLDPSIAEAMVDEDIEVEGLVEAGKLLTLTAAEADRIGYATEVASWDAVLEHLGLGGAEVRMTSVNWAEALVRFFTNPIVTGLLLTLGMLGLIFEVKTPGFGVGGAVGVLALGLFFGSHYLVGLAGWEELILLTVGITLLAIEIFLIPGFGIFGIAGIAGILGSVYLSMVGKLSDPMAYTQAAAVLGAALTLGVVSAWVMVRSATGQNRLLASGLVLGEATRSELGYVSSSARPELIGARGITLTDLRPAGAARFGDERVDVVAEAGWIPAGSAVVILRAEGYRHVVRPVEEVA